MSWQDKPCDIHLSRQSRKVWIRANGPVPDGMHVLHYCDEKNCWEPSHLWLGTPADNTADMFAKGRNRNGFKLTAKQWDEIMDRRTKGESRKTLAKEFGIHPVSISNKMRWAGRSA